jgi:hypothetical protein
MREPPRYLAWAVIALTAVLAGGLAACAGEEEPESEARWNDAASRINGRPTFLAFRSTTVDSVLNGCDPADGPGCTYAAVTYLTFRSAPDQLQDVLHSQVMDLLGLEPDPDAQALTSWVVSDAAARFAGAFLDQNREFRAEFPEAASRDWYVDRGLTVVSASPAFLALSMTESAYTGGAHGNARMEYRMLDAATGRTVSLGDLLRPEFDEALRTAGEAAFIEARGFADRAAYLEAGFFASSPDGFYLNQNFAPTDEGLAFHFDAYEINAYAAGPTDFVIPWGEIRDWVRPDGPLASFLR